jgi:anti-repressor protein
MARWYKKNIEEDAYFTNGVDYIPLDMMSNGNQTKDFQITVEMAKELSMLARTEKGKQARH